MIIAIIKYFTNNINNDFLKNITMVSLQECYFSAVEVCNVFVVSFDYAWSHCIVYVLV